MEQNLTPLDKLDEIVQLAILYDFYGELLSDHKKQIFEDYILNDLSLSEIASEKGISRQGVYDVVRRCSLELRTYEDKLSLVNKFKVVKTKVERMKEIIAEAERIGNLSLISEINLLADDILKEL